MNESRIIENKSKVKQIEPDLIEAQRFIKALAGDEPVTIQTFDDDKERSRRNKEELGYDPYAKVFHGTLDQHAQELMRLNNEGAGIFLTINRTDCKGRTSKNVESIRAVFVDLDGAPLDPVRDAPLKPHILVQSSAGRYHAYWKVSDCSVEEFRYIQKALAKKFNGDPAVCDLARVMRLPGFFHRKAEPVMTMMEPQ